MNYLDMLALLSFTLENRWKALGKKTDFHVLFDGHRLGKEHAKFDIRQIKLALEILVGEFEEINLNEQVDECQKLLSKCSYVI